MKKAIFLLFVLFASLISMAQAPRVAPKSAAKPVTKERKWQYKVGIVVPLPADLFVQTQPGVKSVLVEASRKLSPKIDITFNAGYMFFHYHGNEYFDNRIAAGGLRYNTNAGTYFGFTTGAGCFTENIYDTRLLWSPYVGVKGKRISGDLRLFNWRNVGNELNTLGIVISYNL